MVVKYRWDDFVLDLDAYRLERRGEPVPLEPKALDLLAMLVGQPGRLVTKQEIFDALWPETSVTDHALTRVVAQLRRALGDDARDARYIETVPTRGYRWGPPVTRVDGAAAPPAAPDRRGVEAAGPSGATTAQPVAGPWPRPARAALAAGLALVIAAIGVIAWSRREVAEPPTDRTGATMAWPVQVTTRPGLDLQPAFSPDGGALAFASDRSGGFEIYVRALAGTAADTALTDDGGQNVQPAWSPDGRFIAFHSFGRGGIWVVPARGGVPRQVAPVGSRPTWSPDGRRIVFQSDEHADVTPSASNAQSGATLWMVDADGGHLYPLTRPGEPLGGHAAPAWSPDGRYVAYTVFDGGARNGVWLLEVDSGETRQLEGARFLYEAVFAPDGSALYLSGGDAMIIRLPFDAATGQPAGPRELMPVAGVSGVRGLSISPDGTRLAFAGIELNSQIWAQPIAPDGTPRGSARPITTDITQRSSLPAISQDGSQVAYVARRGGEGPKVWMTGVAGGEAVPLTAGGGVDGPPSWFPDGRRVAFHSRREAESALWTVDVATRREERFVSLPGWGSSMRGRAGEVFAELSLSPSMTRAAFGVITPPDARRVVHVTPLDAFAPRALTDGREWTGYPAWSPDERRLAVEVKAGSDTHAAVLDIGRGTVRRLTSARGQTWVRSWSPDGRRIAAAALRGGRWDLRWIDADTGREGIITPAAPPHVYFRYPEWSPRGDVVAFERGELRGNIWTLALTGGATHQFVRSRD